MVYYLGAPSSLEIISQTLDAQTASSIVHYHELTQIIDWNKADLLAIGPDVVNPVRLVPEVVKHDKFLSIIILSHPEHHKLVQQAIQYTPKVGKNTSSIVFGPSVDYAAVFAFAINRTKQKRSFSKLNIGSTTKLSQLTSPRIKLDNIGHILEYAPIGVLLLNSDFTILSANRISREMFSLLSDGQVTLKNLFPDKEVRRVRDHIDEAGAGALQIEDSEGHWYELSLSILEGQQGGNILILINDITERREKDRRVEAILESLPQIAWTASPEGKLNYYNQGWFKYTGVEEKRAWGEGWTIVVHPDEMNMVMGRWMDAVKGGKSFQQALRLRRFDGEYRWHLSKAVPVYTTKRTIFMWVGTSIDIHDQVMLTEDLERKVRERTKSLEESNAELEQFAHISSHDLQEPLRKIQTFAHIVKEGSGSSLDPQSARYLDKVISTAERMSTSLKDLLTFTRLDHHEPKELVNLNEICLQVKDDLELSITQSGAEITIIALPFVPAKPLQTKQMFYNLIHNAIKFRKPDVPPSVVITSKKVTDDVKRTFKSLSDSTDYWEIIIKDNGIGFDQKYADQIFTVFQRLHAKNKYDGSGIGLAIVKKVVVNHGGEVFVISSEGQGTEFHLILPAS